MVYQGECHCGAVRFQVKIERFVAYECNCSICHKKGFLHLIVPIQSFRLIRGENDLSCYTFNTKVAKHTFCRTCGIHPFYRPRSHPDAIDVNLRCLDENIIDKFALRSFDGQNWEDNVAQIRD